MAFITVGKIRWTGQLCTLAHTHLKDTNISMNYGIFFHWNISPVGGLDWKVLHMIFWVDKTPSHTCAIPSSQPRITSCLPILNLNGLSRSREESNFRPSVREPEDLRGKGKKGRKTGNEVRAADKWATLLLFCSIREIFLLSNQCLIAVNYQDMKHVPLSRTWQKYSNIWT